MNVFIASNYLEFRAEREAVIETVRELGFRPINMEDFGASAHAPIDVCVDAVKSSDCVIVLLGKSYGSLVPESDKSFTHVEISTAYEMKLPLLLYMDVPDADLAETDDAANEWPDSFSSLIAEILETHTVASFASVSALVTSAALDLVKLSEGTKESGALDLANVRKLIEEGQFGSARRTLFSAAASGSASAYRLLAMVELLTNPPDAAMTYAMVMLSRAAAAGDQQSAAALKAMVACSPAWMDVPTWE